MEGGGAPENDELALDQRELQNVFEAAALPHYAIDASFRVLAANKAARDRSARDRSGAAVDPVGERCYFALYQRSQVCPYCPVLTEADSLEPDTRPSEKLIQWRNREHEEKSLRLLFSYPAAGRIKILETLEDVTAQQQRAEETLRKENLASLGIMISGIAHELNNPLTGMGLNLQNLEANLSAMAPEEIQKRIAILRKDLHQASRIVSDILSFSKPGNLRLTTADIFEVIEKAQARTRRLYPVLTRQTQFSLEGERISFSFDAEKVERLLINLFRNSIQALDYAPGYVRVDVRSTRLYAHIVVEDNAGGIPPEQLKNIFKPFYSNSRDGRGSGLGLSICHSIVREHRGRMHVRSQSPRTRFYIMLPLQPGND